MLMGEGMQLFLVGVGEDEDPDKDKEDKEEDKDRGEARLGFCSGSSQASVELPVNSCSMIFRLGRSDLARGTSGVLVSEKGDSGGVKGLERWEG